MTRSSFTRRFLHSIACLCLCVSLSAAYLAAGSSASSASGVRDFKIVYHVDASEELGEGEVRVWFALPDRWRIETQTAEADYTLVAVKDRVLVDDRRAKGFLLLARDQVSDQLDYAHPLDVDLAARYADWEGYLAAQERMLGECGDVGSEAKTLGRPCRRYQSEIPVDAAETLPGLPDGPIRTTTCVDSELLVPLESEWLAGDKLLERIAATSVKVNSGAAESLFALTVPPGARVFKGALPRVPEADFSSPQTPGEEALTPMLGDAMSMYLPQYVPAGFVNTGMAYSADDPEGQWCTVYLASGQGATIVLAESRGIAGIAVPGLPAARPVTVGSTQGEIDETHEPFHRVALTWQMGQWRLRLDAAGVSSAEVLKMAESMRWQTGKPAIEFEDLKAAQAQVHFLVLEPAALPEAARLMASRVTPYMKGPGETYTPEQLFLSYAAPGGRGLTISEMRQYPGVEVRGWERVSVAGRQGWYHYDSEIGHQLNWAQEGTEVSLDGDLPKEQMLKIAASFAPADASARERVRRYQRTHSGSSF